MALSYKALAEQSATESFILRVQSAIIQDCVANRVLATTPVATDVTLPAQRDRLGRQILRDPHSWAIIFARLVAVNLIGNANLLDEAVTSDAQIFSAEGAVFDRLLASL